MSILVIFLVTLLLVADSFIFYVLGTAVSGQKVLKKLEERGWKIEPPEVGTWEK